MPTIFRRGRLRSPLHSTAYPLDGQGKRYLNALTKCYAVEVGVVDAHPPVNGAQKCVQHEIDFVVDNGSERVYIQSAFAIPDTAKREQGIQSLRAVRDGFRRIVITTDNYGSPRMDGNGMTYMGLKTFLLDPQSVENI